MFLNTYDIINVLSKEARMIEHSLLHNLIYFSEALVLVVGDYFDKMQLLLM